MKSLLLFLIPVALIAVEPEDLPKKDTTPSRAEKEGLVGSIISDQKGNQVYDGPLLTGPLLCPSGHTVPGGHFNLEPYLFANNNLGYFNNHWHIHRYSDPTDNFNIQFLTQIGLNKWWDCFIAPQFFFNYTSSVDDWRFGDLAVGTAFQIVDENNKKGIPAIKFEVVQIFPVGIYQNLDASMSGTDIGGGGSFATALKLVSTRLWHFGGHHYLAARAMVSHTFFTNVYVNGVNAYGGDATTVGRVYPGNTTSGILGLEFTLSTHWALANDIAMTYTNKTTFGGTTVEPVGRNEWSYQLSLAPAIEFNANENVGMIGGVWFTVAGRSTVNFLNGVLALNWYI